MTDVDLARCGRVRHWLMDAVLGGIVTLGAITAAHASLPDLPAHPAAAIRARLSLPPAGSAAAPAPAEPAVLIAFQPPVPGYAVDSPFGLRQLPWEEHGRLHAGVDIAAPAGTPILASADGVVTRAGESPSYGRFVEVKHTEGLTTFYAHMGAIAARVSSGTALKAGTPLGEIGSSGTSTGPHLHFELHDQQDRPLNPELFLGRTFATTEALPLRAALRAPRRVRLAQVSRIPESKRALMTDRLAHGADETGEDANVTLADGRVHSTLTP